jgi:c-di-GMP-related signal transduction protein
MKTQKLELTIEVPEEFDIVYNPDHNTQGCFLQTISEMILRNDAEITGVGVIVPEIEDKRESRENTFKSIVENASQVYHNSQLDKFGSEVMQLLQPFLPEPDEEDKY